MLANMETIVLLLKNLQLQTSSLWIRWWGNNQTSAAREPRIRKTNEAPPLSLRRSLAFCVKHNNLLPEKIPVMLSFDLSWHVGL